MATKLREGGYGWGHAKKDLLECILETFSEQREKYQYYMENKRELDEILLYGSKKARVVAQETLGRVRKVCGY